MDGPLHPPPPSSESSFQDGVASVLMAIEELRQDLAQQQKSVTSSHFCFHVRHRLEELMPILYSLQPNDDDEVQRDLKNHCHNRSAAVTLEALRSVCTTKEEKELSDDPDTERNVQAAIARIAELCLMLHDSNNNNNSTDSTQQQDIVAIYVAYQRKVIRQRSKPSIARLVARRQIMNNPSSLLHQAEEEHDDDDDDDDANGTSSNNVAKATHAHVITTILSQASSLIHPLLLWKSQLPTELLYLRKLCTDSIDTLNGQAQTMIQTVATWYLEDKRVDDFWMSQSANESPCTTEQVAELDTLVEELAFCCQIFDRYLALVAAQSQESHHQQQQQQQHPTEQSSPIQDIYLEWTWKYAALEQYLTSQQLQSALRLAHPVQIVIGTPIHVPSVVEDAQYISTRALERAASARSTQAIGTVAHSIASNVWSTDTTSGVYQALLDQQGCYQQESTADSTVPTSASDTHAPNSSSFASALLGALDDEDDLAAANSRSPARQNSRPPSAPSSGTFLNLGSLSSSLGSGGDKLLKIRMETYFCALNGIHSASASCSSLVKFLDSLLPDTDDDIDGEGKQVESTKELDKASMMIQLAREELFRFSKNYQLLLESQVPVVVTEFCGTVQDAPVYRGNYCLPILKYYLERENYNLSNAEELRIAEDDVRLHKQLVQPLQESQFLQQLSKCDSDVLTAICGELALRLVDLFLDCMTSQIIPKRFTDWGSLLLSKQVRTVQNFIASIMDRGSDSTIPILHQWEKLSQVVTVLQLEKPSEWTFYQQASILTPDELQSILSLRVDFSSDAIAAVVANTRNTTSK